MFTLSLLLICAVICLLMLVWFLSQGAIYVPSAEDRTKDVVTSVKRIHAKRLIDLGSGDGTLVIALAQQGYTIDGVELQPWLVWKSKKRIRELGLQDRVTIYWGSMWRFNVSSYDTVVLYAMPHIMERLEKKLMGELKQQSHIISNYFVFPHLSPIKTIGDISTYKIN